MALADDPYAKSLVARSFCMAASGYDAVAALQRSVGAALMSRRPAAKGMARILDIGAGTGFFSVALGFHYPGAQVIGVDIAEGMLHLARRRFSGYLVAGDAESLPIASHSVDLIFSNLALQWCNSLETALLEFNRVLRPGGHLLLSTFGPRTLRELREAWASVDDYSHVNQFESVSGIERTLRTAAFESVSAETELRGIVYPSVVDLMRELKGLGAHNLTKRRPRHLMGKGALARMIAAYPVPAPHSVDGGRIEATYELIYGRAVRGGEGKG